MMLRGLDGAIDVIVPRGGKSLVARVQSEAQVPVFAHLEGICHVYVDRAADLDMARDDRRQRQDAAHRRLRRRGNACSSTAPRRARTGDRWSKRCYRRGLRGARRRRRPRAVRVSCRRPRKIGRTEYLDGHHLRQAGRRRRRRDRPYRRLRSQHTDRIVTGDQAAADRSCSGVDSAIVLHNASHAICRWRRIRHGRGDRYRHRQAPCPRPDRRGAADHLQIPRSRYRSNPSLAFNVE